MAPSSKSKAPTANGGPKSKVVPDASTNASTTSLATTDKKDTSDHISVTRPDKKVFDAEQDRIKSEIDAAQLKLSTVREKISLTTKSGSGNDRRNALRAELDGIRDQQMSNKTSRGKIMDQIKAMEEGIKKKKQEHQATRAKTTFKTVGEVDAYIRTLEKQVESGNMKLADEKRALAEISTNKRNRRLVESLAADVEALEADQLKLEELRKAYNDPESKAISDRYESIKAELDALKKESDDAYAGRAKLFEERDALQSQLNTLFNEKRESGQQFRDANDRYWAKVNEDRARRAERARTQRLAEEQQKKQEIAQRLRDEAEIPAFQAQIEDCQTLIDQFSGKQTGTATFKSTAPLLAKADVAGITKLEIRKVDDVPDGAIVRKKKGEEEEAYFVAPKGKGKGKKGGAPKANSKEATETPSTSTSALNVPLPTLSALLTLSIPPPASAVDVPRVIEDLKTKKAWYEANQARVTAENIAKAEAEIQRLTQGQRADTGESESASKPSETEEVHAEGNGHVEVAA